jgi:GT2 family glycosyltransferase
MSIIIWGGSNAQSLRICLESMAERTNYPNFEILVICASDTDSEVVEYLKQFENLRVIEMGASVESLSEPAARNYGARQANGDVLCFLSSDAEVINPGWLEELASQSLRPEIGVVGALLYNPDDTIKHAGYILGHGGIVGDAYAGMPRGTRGYANRACLVQNMSAVNGACMAVRKVVFFEVGGFEEHELPTYLYDVDFCLRSLDLGYRNLWTPHAELCHHEPRALTGQHIRADLSKEAQTAYVISKWKNILDADPAYNPNLTLAGNWPYMASVSRSRKPWARG